MKRAIIHETFYRATVFTFYFFSNFPPESDVVLTHNKSGRFESRFVSVGIQKSPCTWLRGMEGSALGVWVAHGEGTAESVVK